MTKHILSQGLDPSLYRLKWSESRTGLCDFKEFSKILEKNNLNPISKLFKDFFQAFLYYSPRIESETLEA